MYYKIYEVYELLKIIFSVYESTPDIGLLVVSMELLSPHKMAEIMLST